MAVSKFTLLLLQMLLAAVLLGAFGAGAYFLMQMRDASNRQRLSSCSELVDEILDEEGRKKGGDPYAESVRGDLLTKVGNECQDVYENLRKEKHVSKCRDWRDSFLASYSMAGSSDPFGKIIGVDELAAGLVEDCPELREKIEQAVSAIKSGRDW